MTTKSLLHSSLLDNQYYTSMLVGNDAYVQSYEDILIDQVLTSSQTSFTFSNLNNYAADGYNSLQVLIIGRTDRATTTDYARLRFNGDSGTNYAHHNIYNNTSTPDSQGFSGQSGIDLNRLTTGSLESKRFGAIDITIMNPFNSSKKTVVHGHGGVGGYENNNLSGLWNNTAALTSMTLVPGGGTNFVTDSRFVLIGLK